MKETTFLELDLHASTLAAISAAGYESPTEIQQRAIPQLMAGRDVLATAQTGTGKTAAFVLPMLQLIRPARRRPGSAMPAGLVLTPTRELAVQIVESFTTYGHGSGLSCLAIYGGASRNRQIDELKSPPDVLIATPGRLLDLIGEGFIDLRRVSYLVLDEADRMLDMGFIPAVRRIVAMTPQTRQTALFSATMPPPIRELAQEFLKDPARIAAESGEVRIDRIDQSVLHVDQADKLTLLPALIRDRRMDRVLVFTRTKHRARKVAKVLAQQQLTADAIHGDKSQSARLRALNDFRDGRIRVLVATDVASRGIDVDGVTHVVNFELPNEPETYVHRIGRTARAGARGHAVSLCDTQELAFLRDIEHLMGAKIVVDTGHAYHQERVSVQPTPPRTETAATRGTGSPQRDRAGNARQGRRRRPRR